MEIRENKERANVTNKNMNQILYYIYGSIKTNYRRETGQFSQSERISSSAAGDVLRRFAEKGQGVGLRLKA